MRNALTILSFALLTACSTTKQMDHWQAENFSRSDFDNVLIICVTNN
jgi:hypothetical protein